jgi:hypothetical protein
MSKKFISLLVVFLLSPISSAGQDAAKECRAIVPQGWTPTLEQAQIFIEDESADKNGFSMPLWILRPRQGQMMLKPAQHAWMMKTKRRLAEEGKAVPRKPNPRPLPKQKLRGAANGLKK